MPVLLPIWLSSMLLILSRLPASWSPASTVADAFLPSSLTAVASAFHSPPSLTNESVTDTAISLVQACFSSSRSKAAFMFLKILAPMKSSETLLHRMDVPLQTSPRNPVTFPSFATNENPSPLFRMMSLLTVLRVIRVLSLLRADTVPISSPMDFAASRQAHLPFLPSMNSSVYPRLNVFLVSGVKPPVTVPNEPLTYSPT